MQSTDDLDPAISGTRVSGEGSEHAPATSVVAPDKPRKMEPWVPESEPYRHRERSKDAGREARKASPPPYSSYSEPDEAPSIPLVARGADLPSLPLRRSQVLIPFLLSLLVYLALIPRIILYSNPPTGDQAFYLMVIASIVQDGDLNIANNYAQRDEDKFYRLAPKPEGTVGMNAPYPLPMAPTDSSARPPQERYDHRMPGLPLLLAPAWLVGSWVNLWWPATIIAMCLFGSLLVTNIFLFAYELTGRKWIAWAVWLPAAFSSPIMTYAFLVFTEVVTGLLIIYAFRRLAMGWKANSPLRMLLVGLCIGYIPWMSWRNLPIAIALGAYGLYQFRRYAKANHPPKVGANGVEIIGSRLGWLVEAVAAQGVRLAALLGPMLLAAVLLVIWNLFLYASLTPPSKVPELGDNPPFIWPWEGGKQFTRWVTTGFALLLDRQTGLLVYAPIYVLSVVGIIAMFRSRRPSDRRLLLWMAAITLPYLAIIMSFVFWSGLWGPPARYMSAVVPLLCGPLAVSLLALARSITYKLLYGALALPGLGIMAIMMSDARFLWPANSVFTWLRDSPSSPLKIDLWNIFPSIEHLDAVRLPANTGWMTAVAVLLVLGSFALLLYHRPIWSAHNFPTAVQGLIALGVLGLVGGGWFLMNADYLRERAALVQQNRWQIDLPIGGPQGMAYLDNKLYFADFRNSLVGALDLASGTFSEIKPQGAAGVAGFTNPTDIAVGPDNLLYVLNNGEGTAGVFVIRPDGSVVRFAFLQGRSTVASGIAVGPDGSIWVADTVGGRVIKYGPEGGPALFDTSNRGLSFTNVMDVAVTEDGTLFMSDQSNRIFQANAGGELLSTYETQAQPWYLDRSGELLDVTYDQGFMTINLRTGQTRESRVADGGEPLVAPRGLAHGPDGTLYILDAGTGTITAYGVQH